MKKLKKLAVASGSGYWQKLLRLKPLVDKYKVHISQLLTDY